MTGLRFFAPAVLALSLAAGCAPAVKETTDAAVAEEKRDEMIRNMLEQIDRNAAEIRSARDESAALRERLAAIQSRMDSAFAVTNQTVGDVRGDMSLLASRVDRLESAAAAPKTPVAATAPKPVGAFRPGGWNVDEAYRNALAQYNARKFEAAISAFTEIVTVAPSSALADNAQYWIGESYYSMRNYEKSLQAFTRVFTFPNTNKAADAHLKVGMIYTLMNNLSAAREELNLVVKDYPASDAAKLAAAKLQALGR